MIVRLVKLLLVESVIEVVIVVVELLSWLVCWLDRHFTLLRASFTWRPI